MQQDLFGFFSLRVRGNRCEFGNSVPCAGVFRATHASASLAADLGECAFTKEESSALREISQNRLFAVFQLPKHAVERLVVEC